MASLSDHSPDDEARFTKQRRRRSIRTAVVVLVAVALWQGAVRRPTPKADGASLHSYSSSTESPYVERPTLRVAAFNIAGGVWPGDNRLDLSRTAKYLANYDIVGMEEVHGISVFDWRNQSQILGEQLHMDWLYAPSETRWWHDDFGNGALVASSMPVIHWWRYPLSTSLSLSNRTLLNLTMKWHGRPLTVLITHIDRHDDHDVEVGAIVAAFYNARTPVILMGDLNTDTTDKQLAAVRNDPAVTDAIGLSLGDKTPPGNLDWIFARGLAFVKGGLADNDASDHKLAWAELSEAKQ